MDVTDQVYETEAQGWLAGLYADITATFRAPLVNWIFRTTAANNPDFLRYMWGQVKPIFQTQAFGSFTIAYRDAVLSQVGVSQYRLEELDLRPAAFRELRGQVATFDIVAPRLAVLFETVDRGLRGQLGSEPRSDRSATAPLPVWVDRDRGLPPTFGARHSTDGAELTETLAAVRKVHGLGETLPSIYRCLAQWPAYLVSTWPEIETRIAAVETAAVHEVVTGFVDGLAYRPRLGPVDLEAAGFSAETVSDMQFLFGAFNRGADQSVLPAIHLHAASVGVAGPQEPPLGETEQECSSGPSSTT